MWKSLMLFPWFNLTCDLNVTSIFFTRGDLIKAIIIYEAMDGHGQLMTNTAINQISLT